MPPKENSNNNKENTKEQGKRKKIVKACKDCRRRKVKCDGEMPCSTCKRSSIQCVFESSTPKRGANKHYIESLENRIHVMERALHSLGGMQLIEEAVRRQQMIEEQQQQQHQGFKINDNNRFLLNEIGNPYYIQDILPGDFSSTSSSTTSSSPNQQQDELIQYFMIQIQPYFPIFVPTYFNRLYLANEIPHILIYAICGLSLFYQREDGEEYIQRAMIMLDEAIGKPSIMIIQTLLILLKYSETDHEKSKSLLSRITELCKMLDLKRLVYQQDNDSNGSAEALETRKRTFYMVLRYNVLLCMEQNLEIDSYFIKDTAALRTSDDFVFDSSVITLSNIYQHLRRITKRQDAQQDSRNNQQVVEESLFIMQLQLMIDKDFIQLPPIHQKLKFPAGELPLNINAITRLSHIYHHLNIILLHFHYSKYPLPQPSSINNDIIQYPHRDLSLASSSILIRLLEGMLAENIYKFIPRGVHFLLYCSHLASTVIQQLDYMNHFDEYQRSLNLIQRITCAKQQRRFSQIPASLLQLSSADVSNLSIQSQPQPQSQSQSQPQPPQSQSQQQQQQQQQHQPLHNLHAAPLQLNTKKSLRTTSCVDLRSVQRLHSQQQPTPNFTQHRKPVASVISSSTTSTNPAPYRHASSPTLKGHPSPPGIPYPVVHEIIPQTTQSSLLRQPGKMRVLRKSSSLHGLSNTYRQQQQLYHQQQLLQQQQQQQQPMMPMFQHPSPLDLHRPYQPTLLDYQDVKMGSNELMDDFSLQPTDFNFLSHQMFNDERTEGHPLL
ncbi:hypothetical protein BCV72DRAFT_333128 [Rhizopus microsporus var. microsporus]|uniref:Zn(2)-C6 fungal-type domain-containing protein n=2 Tax=Rhizopus microsporus TaxID=58291 RepID=A0A2G4TA49_RHIZD|nr:uncharacterized protein RHIMIDRAFT_310460 [Rhizopus microsporus ATCC 52813]ORE10310.1 hypothetical protein BCV72DRAFT_333128 [Rhizopus microsporus var. microsporus]PHZ17878.1 hypothetical protein RHIMIDRAFT_310460 [Rhizopus microsporus ATCC 52813]